MTSQEAIKQQWKNLKGKPLKQKLEHIFTYYWMPILITLAVVIGIVSMIVNYVTAKDMVLSINCVNSFADQDTAMSYLETFADAEGIDRSEYDVNISVNYTLSNSDPAGAYATAQNLAAQVAARSMDVLAGDTQSIINYFYQEFFAPLDQVLTAAQLETYRDAFLYVDMAVVRQLRENITETLEEFPDPTKPEDMEEPVAVALRVPEDSAFRVNCFPYQKDGVAIGMIVNTENADHAAAFLVYVMESVS